MKKRIAACAVASALCIPYFANVLGTNESVHDMSRSTEAEIALQMSLLPPRLDETCEAPHVDELDQLLIEKSFEVCFSEKKRLDYRHFQNAQALLKMETEVGIPGFMRGMSLAAACIESGFNENAEGDHRFSADGKTPKAIGILQMWPVFEKSYDVDRRSVESSARGWLTHIGGRIPSVRKRCNPGTELDAWRLAWVHGVRGPKKGGRCKENAKHWPLFLKIKEMTENQVS